MKTAIGNDRLLLQLKDIITGELGEKGSNLTSLVSGGFLRVEENAMHKVIVRHTATTAFRSIENSIAKPFTKPQPMDVLSNAQGNSKDARVLGPEEQNGKLESQGLAGLGFMLRAPITVVASVAWVIGAGIWPFMKQVSSFTYIDLHLFKNCYL